MLNPNDMHPEYTFSPVIKRAKYTAIFKALGNKKVKTAGTFPGLSNFSFERMLINQYPEVVIHCFEKDPDIYKKIRSSFKIPEQVTLSYCEAEKFLSETPTQYDLLFFDYCGGPHIDISSLIYNHLKPSGIFAMTKFRGRGHVYPPITHEGFVKAIDPLQYNHMEFFAYRKEIRDVVAKDTDSICIVQIKPYKPVFPKPLKRKSVFIPYEQPVKDFFNPELKTLSPFFDPAMIDLIDTMLLKKTFQDTSSEMNNRRGRLHQYTPEKVRDCWKNLLTKIKTLSKLPQYFFLQEILNKMEGINGNTDINVGRRPQDFFGDQLEGNSSPDLPYVQELQEISCD